MNKKLIASALMLGLTASSVFVFGACDPKKEEATVDSNYANKTYWEVSTYADFKAKLDILTDGDADNDRDIIKLTADIQNTDGDCVIEKVGKVIIDLNGHRINNYVKIINATNTTNWKVVTEFAASDVSIVDYSENKGGILGSDSKSYGVCVFGNGESVTFNVTFRDITFKGGCVGFGTNGNLNMKGVNISAKNCTFTSVDASSEVKGNGGLGAYLPASYKYAFENCSFKGETGIYAKSGVHDYINCSVCGYGDDTDPVYNGDGGDPTGAALIIDSCSGYNTPITVRINGGRFDSTHSDSIQEFATAKSGTPVAYAENCSITGSVTYTYADGKVNVNSENDVFGMND